MNQTIADTQTSADIIQTATEEASKTGQQRRQDAEKALEDALNKGMGPALITDELINETIPMGTAPMATVLKAIAPKTTGIKTLAVKSMATAAPLNPLYPPGIGFNPAVDYTLPNFSQSPNIRKFMDSLPGLSAANKNNLGQYIPVAVPNTTTYPGSDFYDIGCKAFHSCK